MTAQGEYECRDTKLPISQCRCMDCVAVKLQVAAWMAKRRQQPEIWLLSLEDKDEERLKRMYHRRLSEWL